MPTPQELEAKFWKALGCGMTMMLGVDPKKDYREKVAEVSPG